MRLALLFILVCVFLFFVCFCLPLLGSFCGLLRKSKGLLFLLHGENGDFSLPMKDISSFHCVHALIHSSTWHEGIRADVLN